MERGLERLKKNEESQSHYIPIKVDKYVNYSN